MTVSLTKEQLLRLSVASVGLTSMISLASYFMATRPLTEQAFARQRQLLEINRNRIAAWWGQEVNRIGSDLQNQELVGRSLLILQSRRQLRSNKNNPLSLGLQTLLEPHAANRNSVSLLTKGGIVVFSTDPQRLGMYQPLKNTTTSVDLVDLATTPLHFFTDSFSGRPSISVALPITTAQQTRAGFLAIDLNLRRMNDQVTSQLKGGSTQINKGPDVDAYLAARTSLDRITVISPPSFLTEQQAARFRFVPLESKGLRRALEGASGEGLYLNSQSQPVIGVYQYLPNFRSALMVESLQYQVYKPARRLSLLILVIGLMLSLIPVLLAWRQAPSGPDPVPEQP